MQAHADQHKLKSILFTIRLQKWLASVPRAVSDCLCAKNQLPTRYCGVHNSITIFEQTLNKNQKNPTLYGRKHLPFRILFGMMALVAQPKAVPVFTEHLVAG